MKRYLTFACAAYYPDGGWFDFKEDFDSLEEAIAFAKKHVYSEGTYQIVDTSIKKLIRIVSFIRYNQITRETNYITVDTI